MKLTYLFLIIYLFSSAFFNESYKLIAKNMNRASSLTVLVELIAGLVSLLFIPFFEIKFPTDIRIYFCFSLAIIFYTIQDRLATVSRSGLESSTYGILKQISNVFVLIMGFVFLKEELTLKKIVGSILLIGSNVFVFYHKNGWENKKYIIIGIVANISMGMALFLDVSTSGNFNLAMYVSLTLLIPAMINSLIERVRFNLLIIEYKTNKKYLVLLTGVLWSVMMLSKLLSYQFGEVTKIAPLCSLSVMLNVIFSYIFLNERGNLLRKVIASIFIIIGVFFNQMKKS